MSREKLYFGSLSVLLAALSQGLAALSVGLVSVGELAAYMRA